jgi:hypothetical protein
MSSEMVLQRAPARVERRRTWPLASRNNGRQIQISLFDTLSGQSDENRSGALPFGYARLVWRTVLGWLLVALGGATMAVAVGGCVWVYLEIARYCPPLCQLDPKPLWLTAGLVLAVGGGVLGGGVWALREPDIGRPK